MDENVSRLDITEMVLLLILISPITDTCVTVVSCLHFFQISYLVSYKYFAIKSYLHRNTFSQFSCIKVRFSDRNSLPFKFNNSNLITLVVNYRGILWVIHLSLKINFMSKAMCFYTLQKTWAVSMDKISLTPQNVNNWCF